MNLEATINEFLGSCRRRGLSCHTIRAYTTDLYSFSAHIGNQHAITSIDKAKLNPWIEFLQINYKPRSAKRKIAVVKSMFNWLVLEDYLETNPFMKIKTNIQQPTSLPKNIPKHLLDKLFNSLSYLLEDPTKSAFQIHNIQTMHLALMLLITTGIRVSELCSIQLQDIDFYSSTIRIRGKGNRERNVFLTAESVSNCATAYTEFRKKIGVSHDYLLTTPAGRIVTPAFVRYHLNRYVNKYNLGEKITPHMFRHTTATSLLDRGVNIRHVQKLLGHSNINTTVIYTHVSDVGLKNAVCSAKLENITEFG